MTVRDSRAAEWRASSSRQRRARHLDTVRSGQCSPPQANGIDELDPLGTLVGSSVGSLIGLLGGPIGVAVGMASGLTLGALADVSEARVGADFVEEVAETLTANKVAVIAEVDEEWMAPVDTRMQTLGGVVIRRTLSDVREQLRKERIAAMQADVAQLKQEMNGATLARKAELQARLERLETTLREQQRRTETWFEAFQARRRDKADAFKHNAAVAGRALKQLAKSPPV